MKPDIVVTLLLLIALVLAVASDIMEMNATGKCEHCLILNGK